MKIKKLINIAPFFISSFLLICCNNSSVNDFDEETNKLRKESQETIQKFLNENADKLFEHELSKSIDSISKIYVLDKNKELALRFIETKKGIERINYLKEYISKQELTLILKKIPPRYVNDSNYISIKRYINE